MLQTARVLSVLWYYWQFHATTGCIRTYQTCLAILAQQTKQYELYKLGTVREDYRCKTTAPKTKDHPQHLAAAMGQQSYAPNGRTTVWLARGEEPMTTEEPDELYSRPDLWGGRRVTGAFTRKVSPIT
jgi:hypothetical protein